MGFHSGEHFSLKYVTNSTKKKSLLGSVGMYRLSNKPCKASGPQREKKQLNQTLQTTSITNSGMYVMSLHGQNQSLTQAEENICWTLGIDMLHGFYSECSYENNIHIFWSRRRASPNSRVVYAIMPVSTHNISPLKRVKFSSGHVRQFAHELGLGCGFSRPERDSEYWILYYLFIAVV